MSKTKKPPPPPEPSPSAVGRLEDVVVEVTGKANKMLRDFQLPLIVGAVVIVAVIGIWWLLQVFEARKEHDWSTRIYALLEKPDDEVRTGYPELLASLEGTRIEPYAANKIANRLQETHPEEALEVLRRAHQRHPDDTLLDLHLARLETAVTENQNFQLPEPPPPPEPAPVSEDFPGPFSAEKLESMAPPAATPSPPPPSGDDGN